MSAPLPAGFFERDVVDVARDLVGATLALGDCAGRIVETEAYDESEAACHAHAGVTARTGPLFGPPRHAYVYLSYGIHELFNVVTGPEGHGAAVLIRAIEPIEGIELMRARRPGRRDRELCSGPGRLTLALGIGLAHNALALDGTAGRPVLLAGDGEPPELLSGPRIGITKAAELPWRFCERDNPWISGRPPSGD